MSKLMIIGGQKKQTKVDKRFLRQTLNSGQVNNRASGFVCSL